MGRALSWIEDGLLAQRGALFPWVPVCLACGIGAYFSLLREPLAWQLWLTGLGGAALLFGQRWVRAGLAPLGTALALLAIGFALAGARTHHLAGPVLDFRYYGPVEGRVVNIDRSASDALRLTLDRVVLERMAPADTPTRVRVSLHGQQGFAPIQPGATVVLTGHLGPPGGPVEPGGFDFQRHAWFLQLGAVGYTRNPVLLLTPPQGALPVFTARMWLSERVRAALPGDTGGLAAAMMSGDRSGMSQQAVQALRDTNLAHLLAISGLHMGLLAGFVFGALRLSLLLVPRMRHRWPVKKLAAGGALIAAAGYLALSGGNVATERAFVMVAVALVAVLFDRRALSLHSVALAATIILCLQPEALLGPGFQMSFAATVALVTSYRWLSDRAEARALPWWGQGALSLLVSSVVAGLATAPVGMAHFNRSAVYGLVANLIAMPVVGTLVVPMGVVAALLMPLGLDWIALRIMALGLDWILLIAHWAAGLPGAIRPIPAPGPAVLPLMALGGLMLAIWQGRGRLAGLLPILVGLALWLTVERPAVLIADTGGLVGVMTDQGRALSRDRGAGFVAEIWLENDGSGHDQAGAAALGPGPAANRIWRWQVGAQGIVHVQGKRAADRFRGCTGGEVVISDVPLPDAPGCILHGPDQLRETGSMAAWNTRDGLRWRQAMPDGAWRPWHGGPRPRPDR